MRQNSGTRSRSRAATHDLRSGTTSSNIRLGGRFGIESVGALTVNTDVQPGAKQVSEIKRFYENIEVNNEKQYVSEMNRFHENL